MKAGTLVWPSTHLPRKGLEHTFGQGKSPLRTRSLCWASTLSAQCGFQETLRFWSPSRLSHWKEMNSQAGRSPSRQRADVHSFSAFLPGASPRAPDGFPLYTCFKKRLLHIMVNSYMWVHTKPGTFSQYTWNLCPKQVLQWLFVTYILKNYFWLIS